MSLLNLAYVPFLTPINALQDPWWVTLVPFSILISAIWKALRVRDLASTRDLPTYARDVAVMATLMIGGMVALGLLLGVLIEVLIPMMPVARP
ncbi:MAG: hypothetical protein AB8G96_04160 [Phycisphaerales bacterium]